MAPAAHARVAVLPVLALLAGVGAAARADDPAAVAGGGEAVVVGRRARTVAAEDTTAAATVVDAARFAGESKSVAELVATAPGVAVNQYGGLGQLTTLSIRGSTAGQVVVLLDGLPLNTAAGGGVDFSRIPRAWIERIEVVRGAEGAHYGAGALGGAVNIVTRSAAGTRWSAEATGGSFQTGAGAAELSVGGDGAGALGALFVEGSGGRFPYDFDATPSLPGGVQSVERTHNATLTGGLLSKGWTRAGPGRLDAALHLSGGRREIPGSAFALTSRDEQRDARGGLVARYGVPLSERLQLAVTGTARAEWLELSSQAVGGTTRQRDVAGALAVRLAWYADRHVASVSLGAGAERLSGDGTGVHARPDLSLALADEISLANGDLRIGPALRADRVGPFQGLSGKVGATARILGPLSVRASGGRTFRAPSFAELFLEQGFVAPNPDLAPEQAWSADAALVVDGRLGLASAGAFLTLYDDVIVYQPASFQRVKPFNAGKVAARGVELELASARYTRAGLSALLAFTWLGTEQLRGDPAVIGKELPHRAPLRLFARVEADPGPVAAHVEVHHVGAQWNDLRNVQRIAPALVLNAGLAARLVRRPDLRAHVEVRNLLDDRTLTDGFLNPLPGRTVMVTLRMSGGKESP